MKSTGIIREMDELGRIVIPIELRRSLDMTKGTNIEIFVEDDVISLRKVKDSCVFCGSDKDLVNYMDRLVCSDCSERLKK